MRCYFLLIYDFKRFIPWVRCYFLLIYDFKRVHPCCCFVYVKTKKAQEKKLKGRKKKENNYALSYAQKRQKLRILLAQPSEGIQKAHKAHRVVFFSLVCGAFVFSPHRIIAVIPSQPVSYAQPL